MQYRDMAEKRREYMARYYRKNQEYRKYKQKYLAEWREQRTNSPEALVATRKLKSAYMRRYRARKEALAMAIWKSKHDHILIKKPASNPSTPAFVRK